MEDVALGSRILVRPGDAVPLDGRILSGASRLDQSMLTGEAAPVKRGPGDEVRTLRSSLVLPTLRACCRGASA